MAGLTGDRLLAGELLTTYIPAFIVIASIIAYELIDRHRRNRAIRKSPAIQEDPDKASMVATYGDFLEPEVMRPWTEGVETDLYVEKRINDMLIVELEGRIVGVAAIEDDMLGLLWVDPELHGQGLGRTLMARAEEQLAARGLARGRLECFEPNTSAIAFYEKHGWAVTDTFYDGNARVNKVMMEKELA